MRVRYTHIRPDVRVNLLVLCLGAIIGAATLYLVIRPVSDAPDLVVITAFVLPAAIFVVMWLRSASRIAGLERDKSSLAEMRNIYGDEAARLRVKTVELENDFAALKARAQRREGAIAEAESAWGECKMQYAEARAERDVLRDDLAAALAACDSYRADATAQRDEVNTLKIALNAATLTVDMLESRLGAAAPPRPKYYKRAIKALESAGQPRIQAQEENKQPMEPMGAMPEPTPQVG